MNDLGMKQLAGYLACFSKIKNARLKRLMENYVDDTIGTGRKTVIEGSSITSTKLEPYKCIYDNMTFLKLFLEKREILLIRQNPYASCLKEFSLYCKFDLIRARRRNIARPTNGLYIRANIQ